MSKSSEPEEPPIRFKDSRKIDPVTGQARAGAGGDTPPAPGADVKADSSVGADGPAAAGVASDGTSDENDSPPDQNAQLLEERTRDLQRVSAEYANYRKRADRERLAAGELAVGRTLAELLPVLDDIDRAKAHGDLTGGMKAVADRITGVFDKLGLVAFGEVGDRFDPAMHEAVQHEEGDDVDVPTCTSVMRVGYRHGERLLRAAMVGVTDPIHAAPPVPEDAAEAAAEPTEEAVVEDATASSERTGHPEDETP